MFGLAYLIAFAVYLTVSILVVRWAVRYARKRKKSGMLWGFGAAFIMYNLVFWDWLPTVIVHKYYCATEAGFWVYKTVDQWKAENPGVIETLVLRKPGDRSNDSSFPDGSRMMLNQRIAWDNHRHQILPLLSTNKIEYIFVDINTGTTLAKRVAIGSSVSPYEYGLVGFKFWLNQEPCMPKKEENIKFMAAIKNIGGI